MAKSNHSNLGDCHVRPHASPGLWMAVILPLAVIISAVRHPLESSELYKLCGVFAFGLLLSALIFVDCYRQSGRIRHAKGPYFLAGIAVVIVYYLYFSKGFFFSCYSGISSTLLFYKTYTLGVKHFPRCFTLGEAFVVTQSFLLYLFATVVNVIDRISRAPETPFQISTLVIQLGLFSIGLLCLLPYKYRGLRKTVPFYLLTCAVLVFILLVPLHVLLRRSPLLWILRMLLADMGTLKLVIYWCFCCALAVFAIRRQVQEAKKASTTIRKTFHILAVVVFLPGLIQRCCLLYLASGVMLGLFVALELLRILNLPPLGIFLQDGFFVFSDEKDAGSIALTPIYLLAGCSAPLWIHPAPCDLTDSAGFNLLPLLSGILSVGIGDTAASFLGSSIGRHNWTGTHKTIEGTLAFIVSQLVTIALLTQLHYISLNQGEIVRFVAVLIVTAVVEAKTTQVDNLVLPLIMYAALM